MVYEVAGTKYTLANREPPPYLPHEEGTRLVEKWNSELYKVIVVFISASFVARRFPMDSCLSFKPRRRSESSLVALLWFLVCSILFKFNF
jgi:hypothetical protein